jgi:hypothetical protein
MLLDGSEKVLKFGLDTTDHWWAITEPFTKKQRLTVDGNSTKVYEQIKDLTFSPDGKKWACYTYDGSVWHLVTNDTVVDFPAGAKTGNIQFTPNSQDLYYSYVDQKVSNLFSANSHSVIMHYTGKIFTNYDGSRICYTTAVSKQKKINLKGASFPLYDDVKIIGFWNDGQLVYAGKLVDSWTIFKGLKPITERLKKINSCSINVEGTVAAISFVNEVNESRVILISDEYTEPLVGKAYSQVGDIQLHPQKPMVAYNAVSEGNNVVVLSSSEYGSGNILGKPRFTYDGSELYFIGENVSQFFNINGRNYSLDMDLPDIENIALKPGNRNIAYTTSSTLVVKNLESGKIYAGKMLDKTCSPRYNNRTNCYEALGLDGNKLYLLTFVVN